MTSPQEQPVHPVTRTVTSARVGLREVSERPVWSMDAAATGEALVEVTRLAAQVAQLQMRLLAHGERLGVGDEVGATSAATWLAHQTRTTRPALHRAARLGKSLETAHPDTDQALAAGEITLEQAHVVVEAVDALPTDLVTTATIAQAETFLLDHAQQHDARALRVLGRRLLEVLDPEAADAEEARRLRQEEAAARAAASFTMSEDGHGKVHGRFTLPALHGSMLRKHLLALAAPGRNPDLPATTPTKHKLGLAFAEYVETRPESTVPHAGGLPATVVVTMTLESLLGGLQAAGLCDGTRISAGEARRLACTAGLVPLVLGGASEPLDVGRQRRLHSKAMRLAMGTRDQGCSTVGCDRPVSMCQAHHDHPWAQGGHTNLRTGRLLCGRHHPLAHDPRYRMTTRPDGKVTFTRRT